MIKKSMIRYIVKAFFSPRVFLGTSILFLLFLLVGEAFAAAPELSIGNPLCDTNPPAGPAIRLNWTASTGAASYIVYRNGSIYVNVLATDLTFYNSTNVIAGQSYSYFVRAKNAAGNVISDSNTVNVSIPINICSASAPPSAQIRDYSVSPRNAKMNESATLLILVTNTGSSPATFYAAASLRRPDNSMVDLSLVPLSLSAGQQGNASWNYSFDMVGNWDMVFGIWQESSKANSLGHTGWLNDYVMVNASQPPNLSPPVPSSSSATALSSSRVSLIWQDNANNESGFKIERKSSGGVFSQINTVGAISGSGAQGYYEDTSLSGGTNYCYRVRAYNSVGDSAYSNNEACATTMTVTSIQPIVDTGSASNITSNSATLNGAVNPNGTATGVFFQWGSHSSALGNTTFSQTIGSGTNSINVSADLTGLIPAATYYFRTVAVNNIGATTFGAPKTFTIQSPISTPTPVLLVAPGEQSIPAFAGNLIFRIINTSGGTMNWTASVTSGSSWLSIADVTAGRNNGIMDEKTIMVRYLQNNDPSPRTAEITVIAPGATGSPNVVKITQANSTSSPIPKPTAKISAEPSGVIPHNSQVTISWSSTDATSCTVSPDRWTGTNGYKTETLTASKTYTLNCSGAGGVADTVTVTVGTNKTPLPANLVIEDFTIDKQSANAGDMVKARFIFRNRGGSESSPFSAKLVLSTDQSFGNEDTELYKNNFASFQPNLGWGWFGSDYITVYIPKNTATGNYYIGIVADNGLQKSLPIAVTGKALLIPKPTAKIIASAPSISYNTKVTITWTSTDATSCTVRPTGWTGTSGSQTETLTTTKTYTLNCSGQGGSASDTITVTVQSQPEAGHLPLPESTYLLSFGGKEYTVVIGQKNGIKVRAFLDNKGIPVRDINIAQKIAEAAWAYEKIITDPSYYFDSRSKWVQQRIDLSKEVRRYEVVQDLLVRVNVEAIKAVFTGGGTLTKTAYNITKGAIIGTIKNRLVDPYAYFSAVGRIGLDSAKPKYIEMEYIMQRLQSSVINAEQAIQVRELYLYAHPLDVGFGELLNLLNPKNGQDLVMKAMYSMSDQVLDSILPTWDEVKLAKKVFYLAEHVGEFTEKIPLQYDYYLSILEMAANEKMRSDYEVSIWAKAAIGVEANSLPTPPPYDDEFRVELDAEFAYMQSAGERIKMLKESFAGVTLREKVQKWLYKYLSIGQFDSYNGLVNLAEENHGNYSRELSYSRDYYNKGEITNARKELNDARILRDSLNRTVSTAYSLLGGVIDTAGKVAEAPARVNIGAFKFGCIFAGESVTVKLCQSLMKPLEFAVDYGTQGMDSAKRELITDTIIEVVFSTVPIKELNNQTLSKAIQSEVTDRIKSLQIQTVLSQLLNNPELGIKLTNALTKAGVYGAEEITKNILKKASTKIPAVLGEKSVNREYQLETINADAVNITTAPASEVASAVNEERDLNRESQTYSKYVSALTGVENIKIVDTAKFTNFISYGTKTTKSLGAGERAGVVNSFQSAFGQLPEDMADWQDVIKIANGRWPTQRNETKEKQAEQSFKIIYKRAPNRDNPNDNAAVTIMAYGLRPNTRNFNSEAVAIRSFNYIFKRMSYSANDWDTVRAIAYSGAER